MNYLTHQLLSSEEIEILKKNLDKEELLWEDGKQTAGKQASKVKNNLQLSRDSDLSIKFSGLIKQKILSNELIKSFALPKKVHGTIFSKSKKGMGYGRHIDNAYMSSGRADLSFTIFLNFALFQNSIYGYFISICITKPLKENFYTSFCIIFYIKNELFNPATVEF